MSEKKTVDELQAELEALKKTNLERQIAIEKTKVEEAQQLEQEKKDEELYKEVESKVLADLAVKQGIDKEQPEELAKKTALEMNVKNIIEYFNSDLKRNSLFSDANKLSGRKYEDMVRDMADKGIKWGR